MIWRYAIAVFSLVGCLWASGAAAQPAIQEPASLTGAVLKNRAPVSEEVLRISLPRPSEADLPNGLHVMVLEDRRVPMVSFQLFITGASGYYDPPAHPGLAEFTAAMVREGTTTRSGVEIAEGLETLAASVNVSASMSTQAVSITGSSLSESFDQVLELAADMLLNPSFPEDELERFKQRTRAELVQQRTSPGFLAVEMFNRVAYGDHPAARTAPTLAALDRTTTADLRTFHRARYIPDHAVMAVSGDITMTDARRAIERWLGDWERTGGEEPQVRDPAPLTEPRVVLVDRAASVQTNLVVGTLAVSRTSADYDHVMVMNQIIGGGPTGRLFLNLREDKGYTYGANSYVTALRYQGDWVASTEVRTEVTREALAELMAELARMRAEPVPDAEFKAAKRSMVASFALSLESPATVLGNYVVRYLYDLPADYWDRYPERIGAVTPEDVRAAANRYLDPERLQIVAVGPAETIGSDLERFGSVERFDVDGNAIPSDVRSR